MMFEFFYLLSSGFFDKFLFQTSTEQFIFWISKYSGVTQLVMDWVNIQNLFFGHPKLVTNGIKQFKAIFAYLKTFHKFNFAFGNLHFLKNNQTKHLKMNA